MSEFQLAYSFLLFYLMINHEILFWRKNCNYKILEYVYLWVIWRAKKEQRSYEHNTKKNTKIIILKNLNLIRPP